MAFDVSTITNKGLQLLAESTVSDKFIIDGCDATTTALTLAQAQAVTNRPSSSLSNTTTITDLGSTENIVSCRVYFVAGTNTGGDAKTLYLYGHLQSAPSNIFVLYVVSNATSFHLPEIGDITNEWEVVFNITYNTDTDAVTIPTQATYASSIDLSNLEGRTVTTHKYNDPTQGDNQTIYGEKTWKDMQEFDASIETDYIYPKQDYLYSIGASLKRFSYVYTVNLVSTNLTTDKISNKEIDLQNISGTTDVYSTYIQALNPSLGKNNINLKVCYNNEDSTILRESYIDLSTYSTYQSIIEMKAKSKNTISPNTYSNNYEASYSCTASPNLSSVLITAKNGSSSTYTSEIEVKSSYSSGVFTDSLVLKSHNIDFTINPSYKVSITSPSSASVAFFPDLSDNDKSYLGKSDKLWGNIYCKTLNCTDINGCTITRSSNPTDLTTLSIGAIIKVWKSGNVSYKAGEVVTEGFYTSKFNGSTYQAGDRVIISTKYKILEDVESTSGASFLVQRVE